MKVGMFLLGAFLGLIIFTSACSGSISTSLIAGVFGGIPVGGGVGLLIAVIIEKAGEEIDYKRYKKEQAKEAAEIEALAKEGKVCSTCIMQNKYGCPHLTRYGGPPGACSGHRFC